MIARAEASLAGREALGCVVTFVNAIGTGRPVRKLSCRRGVGFVLSASFLSLSAG
jgi:hypothetical protein